MVKRTGANSYATEFLERFLEMTQRKTLSVSTDPDFLEELSEYLEVLSNPVRLKILKVIEREPREISEIASRIETSYANTKKHIDQLVRIGLVKKEASPFSNPGPSVGLIKMEAELRGGARRNCTSGGGRRDGGDRREGAARNGCRPGRD